MNINAHLDAEVVAFDAKRKTQEPRIKLVPFDQIRLNTDRAYLVKGLIPYPGLTVIWGPPKCGKSLGTAMPGRGRPFKKGASGNPGGRPRVLGNVQELARQQSPQAINTLAEIMSDAKAAPAARVAAANALLDRGYGKPTQLVAQALAKVDPATLSDEELAAIAIGTPIDAN
jgi:hypothetical protein